MSVLNATKGFAIKKNPRFTANFNFRPEDFYCFQFSQSLNPLAKLRKKIKKDVLKLKGQIAIGFCRNDKSITSSFYREDDTSMKRFFKFVFHNKTENKTLLFTNFWLLHCDQTCTLPILEDKWINMHMWDNCIYYVVKSVKVMTRTKQSKNWKRSKEQQV